nr:ribonuclease H-like domain-containing protein [Tanacetum cinerariifolium]
MICLTALRSLSTNKPVSAVTNVFAASAKIPVSALPNVDTLKHDRILEQIYLLQWDFICQKWSATTATRKGTLQESVDPLRTQEGMLQLSLKGGMFQYSLLHQMHWFHSVMVWAAMTGAFRQKKNQPTMPSWHSPPQVLPVLTMSSKTDESLPASPLYDRYQSRKGYHVVPPPYTGTFMPPKPDLVSDSEDDSEAELSQNVPSFVQPSKQIQTLRPYVKPVKNSIPATNPKTDISKPQANGNNKNRKACFVYKSLTHLIKLHTVPTPVLTKSKLVPLTAARPVTTAVPQPHVTRPRPAKTVVTKSYLPLKRNINHRPSLKPSNFPPKVTTVKVPQGNPHHALKDKRVIDSGCSRHMTRNMSYLSNFEEINGGYVAIGGNPKGGKITRKGKIRTVKLDFDDVYFVKELKFNLFSVSQMCDKKNNVLFIDTECIVLSLEFKLSNENQVLLRVPKENNMYNVDLKNIVPSRDLTCLFAKATLD